MCFVVVTQLCFFHIRPFRKYNSSCSNMSRTSLIVSREPPDPEIDPRVQDMDTPSWRRLQRDRTHTNKFLISEQFSYFDEDLNVVDENGDDNDYNYTDKNEGYDSNVVDDVTDVINATNKSRITKREKILERQAFFAEVVQKTEDSDKRNI